MKSSNSHIDPGDLVQIGQITGAHGIRGDVKAYSYAESKDFFALQSRIMLIDGQKKQSWHTIQKYQLKKNSLRLTLEHVTTREQAEALKGCGVFIHRRQLPDLNEGTYYWVDLMGMAVYTVDGEHIGTLTQIISTGANDVYVIQTQTSITAQEILVPAIASVVKDVDIEQRRIEVDLPEGLV